MRPCCTKKYLALLSLKIKGAGLKFALTASEVHSPVCEVDRYKKSHSDTKVLGLHADILTLTK